MSIFDKRVAFKPFEYPEVSEYKNAIAHSYWLVSEFNFISDVQDYNVRLNDSEKNSLKNAILAVSQIEVSVKKFWTKLGDKFPKAEVDQVGVCFGECEVRHSDAYSELLEVLGMNGDFEKLLEVPAIRGRIDYLTKYLKNANDSDNKKYSLTLALFSIFIENVSLFSQFLIIKSFNKCLNVLKDIDNVIQATMREEQIHALFGVYLINQIKKEFSEWFNEEFYASIYEACNKSYDAEMNIIDWIFEKGELPYLSKDVVKEFIKNRFNESLDMIGCKKLFTVDNVKLKEVSWFDEEMHANVKADFFYKKPVTYSKKTKSIKAEDLF